MELTAQQLRIGNLIYWDIPQKAGVPHRVVGILEDTLRTIPISIGSMNEYKPIPLTEEILIRLGFKKGIAGYEKGDFDIRNYGEYWIEYGLQIQGFCPAIKYVHQLQNLFYALTGTELTLNN